MSPWIKYIMIAGALQGFVFAVALFRLRAPNNSKANGYLISLLMTVSIFMMVASQADLIAQVSRKLVLLSYVLIFTYCPLYYLFVESSLTPQFRLKRSHLFLLLPALVFIGAWLRYAVMPLSQMQEIFFYRAYYDLLAADTISIFLNLVLVWKAWRLISRHEYTNEVVHKAFLVPTLGLVIANISWLLMVLSSLGIPYVPLSPRPDILYLSMSFLVLLFGYFLVLRPSLFAIPDFGKTARYQHVNIDEAQCSMIKKEIINVLVTGKNYKNPEFSLTDLADLTGIDKVKLSYTINAHMNSSFTALINKYRIEEFVALMEAGRHENYNLFGVAAEAGFSSKSTFYKAFKDQKGRTPKEFFSHLPEVVKG
ncbi:MAG: AraC family transcriptional regulator [Cyclobacteriaceae bacterium]|nr:AraC family transcriptional regulator [Cyclobacteriaceae bacterium]